MNIEEVEGVVATVLEGCNFSGPVEGVKITVAQFCAAIYAFACVANNSLSEKLGRSPTTAELISELREPVEDMLGRPLSLPGEDPVNSPEEQKKP